MIGGAEPAATRAAQALAGLRDRTVVHARLPAVDDGARARLTGVLGAMARAGDAAATDDVLARLADASPRVRRAAATALGKLGGDRARDALIARWDAADVTADERRALAEALGKVGGDDALARLRAVSAGADRELERRRDRALIMADRSARRDEPSHVALGVPPPAPVTVRLGCKPGLEPLLREELAALGRPADAAGPGVVDTVLRGPWRELFASRLWATAAVRLAGAGADPGAIVRAIAAPPVRALLRAWTVGPIRWRLGFASGHRRAVVWRVARDVAAAAPELINDPTATTWDVLVDDGDGGGLALVPRRLDDPRFAWRVAEVPAASHPTVAAALAWLGEARPGDRVWDPFCGSGAELIERARRGAYGALVGSDLDPAALDAARANLAAAGLDRATLAAMDARDADPGAIDLVITNPPLGSRVQVDAAALLAACLPNLARRLVRGGRLVWITPAPKRTTPAAERAGLRRTRALAVDLGGVRGELERWERP